MIEEQLKELFKISTGDDPDEQGFDPEFEDDVLDLLNDVTKQIKSLKFKKEAIGKIRR